MGASEENTPRVLRFDEFVELALYHPEHGYYRRGRPRVGYGAGTDFLTATASAPLFGRLVAEACRQLLGGAKPSDGGGAADAGSFRFVEIGAEPAKSPAPPFPFASHTQVQVGEPIALSGKCIVFSNELFDAQPFRRFRRRAGAWRELGVKLEVEVPTQGAVEVEIDPVSAPRPRFSDAPLPSSLPESAPEGYVIDAPTGAAALAARIAAQPWTGLFVAFDYGKSWEEIAHHIPEGTARAYRRHVQSNDLLAHPGDQDLTCHVCWDWIADALREHGFQEPVLESQERFFTRHAGDFISATIAAQGARFSRDKLSILQLLHPANMGQNFQVLWAKRG